MKCILLQVTAYFILKPPVVSQKLALRYFNGRNYSGGNGDSSMVMEYFMEYFIQNEARNSPQILK